MGYPIEHITIDGVDYDLSSTTHGVWYATCDTYASTSEVISGTNRIKTKAVPLSHFSNGAPENLTSGDIYNIYIEYPPSDATLMSNVYPWYLKVGDFDKYPIYDISGNPIRDSDVCKASSNSNPCVIQMICVKIPAYPSFNCYFIATSIKKANSKQLGMVKLSDQASADYTANSDIPFAANPSALYTTKQELNNNYIIVDEPIAVPAGGETDTYDFTNITSDHIVSNWNFSTGEENNPICDITIETFDGYFTITNNSSSSIVEYLSPAFIKYTEYSAEKNTE